MIGKTASLAIAALLALQTASPSLAGGRASECYERYNEPDLYGTVLERRQINPASRHVAEVPPIYGTRQRAVQIAPAYMSYEIVPAVTRTHTRLVRVPGGHAWEWRVIGGRKVLCKVWRKAHYRRVAETVVVRAAYRRPVAVPAAYATETERVLIRPGERQVIDSPATYRTIERTALVERGRSGWQRVRIRNHCAD